jgi:signal transduction histidine kinase
MERGVVSILRWALASAVVLVPALVLAAQLRRDAGRLTGSSRLATVLRAGDIAVLATLPAVALAPLAALTSTPFLQPLVVWLAVVGITRVVAVLPVVREAAREARDRSLVVDEGESSARIAADIHDDVIQDLSMLVHRLTAGEDEAAATLRAAIDRLRAICADLRLPVIHDLGSRALEALVSEVRVASGSTSTSSTTGGAAALRRRARALPHRAGGRGQRRQARSPADRGAPPRRDGPGRARGR